LGQWIIYCISVVAYLDAVAALPFVVYAAARLVCWLWGFGDVEMEEKMGVGGVFE
jgi:hypothetical protein